MMARTHKPVQPYEKQEIDGKLRRSNETGRRAETEGPMSYML